MIQHRGRLWLAVGCLLAMALVGLAAPVSAATRTVTLTGNGPSPAAVTITAGDRIVFVNADDTSHTVTDTAGPWSFRATIAPGRSAGTPVFTTAGSYGYNDAFFVAVVQQNAQGSIQVRPAPSATTSPTPRPTAKPTPSRSPSVSPSATRSPSPSPSAVPSAPPSVTPSATPSATTTAPPSAGPSPRLGSIPQITLAPSTGPTPAVASPETSAPAAIAYGPVSEIAQPSAHRYGLPVLLALLAVAGVLSLLVRLLLAQPVTETATQTVTQTGTETGTEMTADRRTGFDGVVDDDRS